MSPIYPPVQEVRIKSTFVPKLAIIVAACLWLGSCGGSSDDLLNSVSADGDSFQRVDKGSTAARAPYRVGPVDVLKIKVFQVEDLDRTVQVAGNGVISLPLIGQVRASGRTTQEIESDIANRLRARYLKSPQVSVFIEEYNSQKVTVGGAVKKPGVFPMKGDITLLEAIAKAEGLDNVADASKVLVFRQVDSQRYAARFDLTQIRNGQVSDPRLRDGDVVEVDGSRLKIGLRDWSPALSALGSATSVFRVIP